MEFLLALGLYPSGPLLHSNSLEEFCSFVNVTVRNIAKRLKMLFMINQHVIAMHLPIICCVFTHCLEGKPQSILIRAVNEGKFFPKKIEKVANFAPVLGCSGASRCAAPSCFALINWRLDNGPVL